MRRGVVFGAGLTALPAIAAACGGDETSTSGATGTGGGAPSVPASGTDISMDDLIAAAKEEGTLNTIALPPDWANYGEIMDTFQSKYGIKINNANPNGSSAEENQAVKSLKGQDRAPDVLDVGPSFAAEGKTGGLYANYKNSQWDTIPDDLKDADGAWVGDYWGAVSLGANTKVAPLPASWADLKKSEYKGKVALNGDPARVGLGVRRGLRGLGRERRLARRHPARASTSSRSSRTPATSSPSTPRRRRWRTARRRSRSTGTTCRSPTAPSSSRTSRGRSPFPSDAAVGNFYCQAINADAPNPFAARLWQEFLYSDEGQLLWLKGYSHPARFQDMSDRGVIPQDLLDALPSADLYANIEFPTPEQSDAATQVIADGWDAVAG